MARAPCSRVTSGRDRLAMGERVDQSGFEPSSWAHHGQENKQGTKTTGLGSLFLLSVRCSSPTAYRKLAATKTPPWKAGKKDKKLSTNKTLGSLSRLMVVPSKERTRVWPPGPAGEVMMSTRPSLLM